MNSNDVITADEAWLLAIAEIKKYGDSVEPQKSWGAKNRVSFEILNHTIAYDMRWPVVCSKPNTSWIYMAAEPMWVLAGSKALSYCPEIERIQGPYSDNGISLYGAYGPQFKLQKSFVIDRLNNDKNTRQAVMTIWKKSPPYMKDIACTLSLQFLIRNGNINTIVNMRSSDAGLGLPYDMLTFACMTMEINSLLREPVELGKCWINAGSRHIYEDQFDSLDISDMTLKQYRYPAWNFWKWTAIKQVLERIAFIDTTELNRRDVQVECFKGIMEAAGGKTNS